MPGPDGTLTPEEVAQEQLRQSALQQGVALSPQASAIAPAGNIDVVPPMGPPAPPPNFDPASIDLNVAPGGSKPDAGEQFVGYQPIDQPPIPADSGTGADPGVGPQAPYLDYGQAKAIADASAGQTGPVYTAGNILAMRKAAEINEKNEQLKRQMGDRYAALGETQGQAHDDIAFEKAKADQNINDLNEDNARKDAEQAAHVERVTQATEAGRKEYLDAAKNFNPDRLLGNAGRRVAFTVATALGALGAAFLKQGRNGAVDIINDALARDAEQQRVEIGSKRENVSMLQQQIQTLRATGVDDRSARMLAIANAKEGIARYVDTRLQSVVGEEARTSGMNLRDTLNIDATKDRLMGYQAAAKPSGKRPPTELEKVKSALELQKLNGGVRNQELAEQTAELKAAKGAQTPEQKEAAINRQSKIATNYAARDSAVRGLESLREKIAGSRTAMSGALPNLTNSEDIEKAVQQIQQNYARGRGGPITAADQQISESINNILPSKNPLTWSDSSAVRRIDALLNLTKADRDAVFEGQNARDVEEIKKTIPKRAPSAADVAARITQKRK